MQSSQSWEEKKILALAAPSFPREEDERENSFCTQYDKQCCYTMCQMEPDLLGARQKSSYYLYTVYSSFFYSLLSLLHS